MSSAKIASVFILFALALVSGVTSCLIIKFLASKYGMSPKFKRAISLLNCFSGGVFFATSLLILVPEAREKMEDALDKWNYETDYPLTEILTGVGFLLILGFEHFARVIFSNRNRKESSAVTPQKARSSGSKFSDSMVIYKKLSQNEDDMDNDHTLHEDSSGYDENTYQTYGAVDESLLPTERRSLISSQPARDREEANEIIKRNGDLFIEKDDKITTSDALQSAIDDNTNTDHSITKVRGLLLLIALSLHMIFDGLALGLLKSDSKVWQLLLALCLHKAIVFFTIGLQILEILRSLKKSIAILILFSLTSPFGVCMGLAVTSNGNELTQDAVSAILQGVATGTFLYVTFFEILQREFGEHGEDLLKVLFTVLGFSFIATVRLLGEDTETDVPSSNSTMVLGTR